MARLPYPPYQDKHFAAAGKPTINVLKLLSYSSSTVEHWGTIGNAQFTQLELSKKNREFVVLLAAAKFRSAYEWTHHIPLSAKFGITHDQQEEIRLSGTRKGYLSDYDWSKNSSQFSESEQVLLQFVEAVIDTGEVDEALWQRVTKSFSPREIVEMISVQASQLQGQTYCKLTNNDRQGFYYTLARLTTVLKVDFDGDTQPRL